MSRIAVTVLLALCTFADLSVQVRTIYVFTFSFEHFVVIPLGGKLGFTLIATNCTSRGPKLSDQENPLYKLVATNYINMAIKNFYPI